MITAFLIVFAAVAVLTFANVWFYSHILEDEHPIELAIACTFVALIVYCIFTLLLLAVGHF